MRQQTYEAVAAWRAAGEAGDAAAAAAALDPAVRLVSPITEQFTFDGRDRYARCSRWRWPPSTGSPTPTR